MENFPTSKDAPQESIPTRELIKNYPQIKGRFYHGCPSNVDKLLPPDETGEIRPGEEERRSFKDVIFLTTNLNKAIDYAGPEGTVFITNSTAVQYKPVAIALLNQKKAKSLTDDIFIALPENIKIITKWHKEKRKRGESQKYTDEYVGEK